MTLQEHFQEWLKDCHPEADTSMKKGEYTNSTTKLLFAWLQGAQKYFMALKKEREGRGA